MKKFLLILVSVLPGALGFVPLVPPVISRTYVIGTSQQLHLSTENPSPESSDQESNQPDKLDDDQKAEATTGSALEPPSEPSLQPIPQSQKQLDPLVRSLTRMDPETASAPTMNVPLWGELILDQSLFVLLPVAAFAVIGFFFSIYIALNAGDAFVELEEAATLGKKAVDAAADTGCRGICSSQEQDLEGLRVFMNSFSK